MSVSAVNGASRPALPKLLKRTSLITCIGINGIITYTSTFYKTNGLRNWSIGTMVVGSALSLYKTKFQFLFWVVTLGNLIYATNKAYITGMSIDHPHRQLR